MSHAPFPLSFERSGIGALKVGDQSDSPLKKEMQEAKHSHWKQVPLSADLNRTFCFKLQAN